METTARHKKEAPKSVKAAVITVSDSLSDSREGQTKKDISGAYISAALKDAGHDAVFYSIVPDSEGSIKDAINHAIESYSPDIIITTGGTGITKRDVTIESVSDLLDKTLDGFGELFRRESFERVGSAALLSRAIAGVINGTVIFSLPGSPDAVRTGMNIILKEAGHIVRHAKE